MPGLDAVRSLYAEYAECTKCPRLCESRSAVIFGSGSASADIVVVGKAPGLEEEITGIPFTGPTGRFFMQLFGRAVDSEDIAALNSIEDNDVFHEELRALIEENVFFTNAVLCFPGEDKEPSAKEISECRQRLHHTVYAVDPKLIIAAGKTAAAALLGKKVRVLDKRGSLMDVPIESPATGRTVRYPMLVVLDPGQVHRSGDQVLVNKKKGKAYQMIEDIKRALYLLKTYETIAGESNGSD